MSAGENHKAPQGSPAGVGPACCRICRLDGFDPDSAPWPLRDTKTVWGVGGFYRSHSRKKYIFFCFQKHGVWPAFFVTVLRIAVFFCVFRSHRHHHADAARLLFAAFSRISASTSTFRMQYGNLRPHPYHWIQAAASARDGSTASRAWAVPSSTSPRGSFSANQPSQPPVFNAAKSLNLGSRCPFRRQIADWHSALTVLD